MFSIPGIPLWLIVVAIILVVFLVLFRTMNQVYLLALFKKNFFYMVFIALMALVVISVINIHMNNDFDYSTLDGWKGLGKVYFSWLGGLLSNVVKVTGYAIQQDWIPGGNSTG